MSNPTNTSDPAFSTTPICTLYPQQPLLHGISDHTLSTFLPTLVYFAGSAIFYAIDKLKFFDHYRIHPSEDELQRNRVSRRKCLQVVVRYHVIQIGIGLLLTYNNGPELVATGDCETYQWARWTRNGLKVIPWLLTLLGLDTQRLASVLNKSSVFSFVLPNSLQTLSDANDFISGLTFSDLEWNLARFMVSVGVPAVRFLVYLAIVDTWIYFMHRLCHVNKRLYRIVHAQHHELYVPYAYGAVYAHWLETLFLDILSFVLANAIAGVSVRQSMVLSSLATLKTISDHCGYVFPWDPMEYINGNGAQFHDLHHQSWGLKHNYATYTVFWDRVLGTAWTDAHGANARYARTHELVKARTETVAGAVTTAHSKKE